MANRKTTLEKVIPKMIRFQSKLEGAIQNAETGRHQFVVQVVKGEIKKIQIFSEDTVELDSDDKKEPSEGSK